MQRYFVRYTPIRKDCSQFFAVRAESYLQAARLALQECDLEPEEFDEDDCLAVSQECIPLPGEIPHDLRYIPVQCFMLIPASSQQRRRA